MTNVQHHILSGSDIHVAYAFTYADATSRTAASLSSTDIGKISFQTDEKTFWILNNNSPTTWTLIGSGTMFVSGADPGLTYLVLSSSSLLSNERVFSVSGSSGLIVSDAGSNGTLSLSINNNVVATVSGTRFIGPVSASAGLSGSLQQVGPNLPYLLSQGSITITTQSNGQVIISGSGGSGGTNPTAGTGILVNGSQISINNNVVATVSGTIFTGPVSASAGLSGSLQQVFGGLSYLVSGPNVQIVSQSNGQIVVTAVGLADVSASYVTIGNTGSLPNERALVAGDGLFLADGGAGSTVTLINIKPGDISASYVTIGNTGSLPNERSLIVGTGLILTDGGAGSTVSLAINDNVVATVSGTRFTGPISASAGLTGSLQQVSGGMSYLVAGTNVQIISQSNGQIVITAIGLADVSASYVTIGNTGSLPNERALTAGTGLLLTDGGAGSTVILGINNNVVATVSGTLFTGVVSASSGLSGSLQQVGPGLPYLLSQGGITITTQSNGQVIISGSNITSAPLAAQYVTLASDATLTAERVLTAGDGLFLADGGANSTVTLINIKPGDISASYVTIGNTGSLPNERALTMGTGLISTDGGAGSTITLAINDNIVATVSGTRFTGVVSASAGLSGSLQQVGPGLPYLLSQGSITITTQSNGQVIISGSGGGSSTGAPTTSQYVTLASDAALSAERVLTAGDGLFLVDGGANSTVTLINIKPGDISASYVTIGNTGSLPNERALTAGTGLILTDGGAGSTVTLTINDNVIAMVSGTRFTGPVSASAGLSGSLQQVSGGMSYLVAGTNVQIVSQSNGQIVITAVGLADVSASYVTIGNTGSLPNERALTAGTGVILTDGGAGSTVSLGINNNVVATISGTLFTGVVSASAGLSGSLQQVGPGLPYLLSQGSITITTQSNGQVIISGSGGGSSSGAPTTAQYVTLASDATLTAERVLTAGDGLFLADGGANSTVTLINIKPGDISASYVTIGNTGSLPNERALAVGTGLLLTDGGAGSTVTLAINNNVVATISGTTFTGPVSASAGLSGSLQQVSGGMSYLVAGPNMQIVSQSNGQIILSAVGLADVSASYVTIGNTGSLPNERALTAGTGLLLTDAGAGSTVTLGINNNVVATISGALFTGVVSASAGLSGSLQQVGPGLPYLLSQGGITITTQSNGQIIISGSNIISAPVGAQYVTLASDATLPNERVLTAGDGLFLADGGANSTVTLINIKPGDISASYITITNTGSLPNERALAVGTGLILTDGGAGSTVTLAINNNVVATVSGTTFTGPISASAGLSGSLQQVSGGMSYLVAGPNMQIISQSNGQIILSAVGHADVSASYVTIGNTGSLPNERALTAGTGLLLTDAGAGSTVTLGINNNVVATVSGTLFTGVVSASAGLSGSLQQVGPGLPYLLSQGGVTITTQSNGQLIISGSNIISAPVGAQYVTLTADSSLSAERVLTAGDGLFLADGGANSTVTLINIKPGDISASYVTVGNTGSLPNERALTAGSGLILTDGGAGSTITLAINDNIVATVSGTRFTGPVSASAGLSGSLQQVSGGLSYLVSGPNIQIVSQSNGQIVITAVGLADSSAAYVTIGNTSSLSNERALTAGDGLFLADGGANSTVTFINIKPGDISASYVTIGNTGSLPNERALTAGTGLILTDGGAGSTITFGINDNIVATVSGTRFTGPVSASAGLSGSLQQVSGGLSYLVAGPNMQIISQSNGQIVLSAVGHADVSASYVTIGNTGSLPNERALTAGTGLILTDGGAGSTVTFAINDNIVATVSGTRFTGPISASAGLSGSLQQVSGGMSYLVAGPNMQVISQSNGQVILSAVGLADVSASYVTIGNTGSLPNERALTAGTGIILTDGGAGSTVILGINNNVVATVSGTLFTGVVSASAGLSGSLQQVGPGLPYLLSQGGITLTTQSNGQVIISGSGAGSSTGAPTTSQYVTLATDAILTSERVLTAGTGLLLTDGGAGSTVTLAINDNIVATVSGTKFTGVVSASAGLSGSIQQVGPGLSYLVAGTSVTITSQSNGQIVIASTATGGSGTTTWIDGGAKLKTSASVAISADNVYADSIGTDVFFFVSGSTSLTGSSSNIKKSVFGGDVLMSGALSIAKTVTFSSEFNNGNKGSISTVIDWRSGQKQKITITGSFTASFVDPAGACNLMLKIVQDSTGNRTIKWPSSVKWPNSGSIPTLSTQSLATDLASFYYDGTTYFGMSAQTFV